MWIHPRHSTNRTKIRPDNTMLPRLRFPAGILRNPVIPFFSSFWRGTVIPLLQESSHPGGRPGNRAVWSSVEIYVGFKTKYASYFCPNISTLLFNVGAAVAVHPWGTGGSKSSLKGRRRCLPMHGPLAAALTAARQQDYGGGIVGAAGGGSASVSRP